MTSRITRVVCVARTGLRWMVCSLLLTLALPASSAPDKPAEMGPVIAPGQGDAEWQPFLKAMAAKGAVMAPFTEHRWFPFRKDPVVLKGEMRLSPMQGLSLRYTTPDERLMVVDDQGILLRDDRGRSKAAPAEAGDSGAAMLPVLRFDLPALVQLFKVHASRAGEAWRFDLVPRPGSPAARMGRMIVIGEGETVRQLEFRRSAAQRVEIFIAEARTGVTFTAEEQKKFFR